MKMIIINSFHVSIGNAYQHIALTPSPQILVENDQNFCRKHLTFEFC